MVICLTVVLLQHFRLLRDVSGGYFPIHSACKSAIVGILMV